MVIGSSRTQDSMRTFSPIACQSPILSEQDLIDIPHMEGLMFNAMFTYLKIFDVTCYQSFPSISPGSKGGESIGKDVAKEP